MRYIPEQHRHIPSRWMYGDAGDRYPVSFGDIWQTGSHLFACGDLEVGHAQKILAHAHISPVATFVDPPWLAGNAAAFRTKAGVPRKVDYMHLMSCIFEAIAHVPLCVMIMGNRSSQNIMSLGKQIAFAHAKSFPMFYYRVHPCRLLLFSQEPLDFEPPCADEDPVWKACMSTLLASGNTIFDPCVGRGGTAIHAHQHGCTMIGMELHPRRMAVTLDRLEKAGSGTPQKIGELHG
jgi:hypothetical protein